MYKNWYWLYLLLLMNSLYTYADSFNTSFLVGNAAASKWNSEIEIEPGYYDFNLYINERWLGVYSIYVKEGTRNSVYFREQDLIEFGLKLERYPNTSISNTSGYINIEPILAGGSFDFDPNEFNLHLTIPQAYIENDDPNWVTKNNWDPGINGLYINYHANYFNNYEKNSNQYNESLFLSLTSGLNLLGFHFVDVGSITSDSGLDDAAYMNTYRYVEKPILSWDSVLRIGKQPSSTGYFDSIKYTGVSLRKDMRMLPDSYGRYMPVIRGVAAENAIVTIKQDGRVLERINLPVGEYYIDNLMPTGSRSDLEVTLSYSSGRTESFIVPYSTISGMLREGSSDYNINIGHVEDVGNDDAFIQGEYTRGINNYLTGYMGITLADNYQSYLLGSSISIPKVGSFSLDVEQSFSDLDYLGSYQGQKINISYSKYFSTKTNLTLASYFYKTDNYLSLQESLKLKDQLDDFYLTSRVKESYNLNLSQPIGKGQLYFDGYFSRKNGMRSFDKQFNLTYNQTIDRVHYSLTLGRSYTNYEYFNRESTEQENRIGVSISMPLAIFDNSMTLTSRLSVIDDKYRSGDVILSGYEDDLTYSFNVGHDKESKSYLSAYASYQASKMYINGSYSESESARQVAFGASGSLVAYEGGVLATSQSGNNFVIIDTPGIEGAVVNNDKNTVTNSDGQAIVATASPYRRNTYTVQHDDEQGNVNGNVKYLVPLRGTISKVSYETDTDKRFIFQVTGSDGRALPFGSDVFNEKQESIGYVLQGGKMTFRAASLPNQVSIQYLKNGALVECQVDLHTDEENKLCF
ncbi:fimbria/pilus outer membrane usher protein [Vibrio cincinnatiensis]|uniref:fimbria/pilus outer membrane usher protein n=1 Tax=Vibrio cincinnatiensis TaxID=675 RepID=UPI001EDFB21E|nr:fimbria/pilus outer membrane usher protein [Vibrio cincinnatiensis]MCG3728583.1 fimbrial biogenesis outer membrane usher protein [Vibrio cincinnatiensis]